MKTHKIVICTGFDALFAYLLYPNGNAELVERIEFQSWGQTGTPLLHWEDETLCYQTLGEIIEKIVLRYNTETWGLACKTKQYGRILEFLPSETLGKLTNWVPNDDIEINRANVVGKFSAMPEAGGAPVLARTA
ncbi:hypothetical protein ACFSSA_10965 [Luteolibacter algae]|uniref:Uncharacterized protein n=1 Tax=Luteolibacter algae TaxID=454151 RepID=A0ABW5D835_9BACT